MAEPWSGGDDAEGAWREEPASLFASTAPFCDSAVGWSRVDGASLALLSPAPNSRKLVFATDALAQRIDELQFALGEGPCLECYGTGLPRCVTDLAHDERWTLFCREAVALGVGAAFNFPVRLGDQPVGVLELYRRDAGPMTVDEYDAALGCAAAIGAVIGSTYARWTHRVADDEDLNGATLTALTESDPFTRSQVHIAAGVVAERLRVSVGEALVRMRAFAFARDRRITEVADDVVGHRVSWRDWQDEPSGGA
ncbi:GAF domain-containing protein [Mycobacterium sp. CPCC 205372]|uniref:GAF domain-containing protein n=1 Tax=Mycobacterium hippophais TaxID=3016340 RepID=A0ABT4Q1K7_9MYCO|nr:GAF domain-containing protein [Mycobacterium hippophais]MCZ8382728.1 GAF domain-containing protein [Mycobacterium hippophais]